MIARESCGPFDKAVRTCRAGVAMAVKKERLPVLISLSVKEKNCG